ncbi:hypothetical protein JCM17092_33890 [Haloplanus litoreus]
MVGADAWVLYSSEGTATHLKRPEREETYCGDSLESYRPQGRSSDPSAFHAQDQFCTQCLYEALGTHSIAMLDELDTADE